jgi:hypothetical protein
MDKKEFIKSVIQDLPRETSDEDSYRLVRMRFSEQERVALDSLIDEINATGEIKVDRSDILGISLRRLVRKLGMIPTLTMVEEVGQSSDEPAESNS